MKKLSPYLAFILVFYLPVTFAQVQTVHDPKLGGNLTNDQVASFGQAALPVDSGSVVLNFEGLGNLEEIGGFYNGQSSHSGFAGTNYAVSFSAPAVAVIDSKHGGTGNFTGDILPNTVLVFLSGCEVNLTSGKGFSEILVYDYSTSTGGIVTIYDGPGGTGNMLASEAFQPLALGLRGESGAYYDSWKQNKVSFSGIARSVVFTGVENQCAIDNIRLGSGKTGSGQGMTVKSSSSDKNDSFGSMLTTPRSQTDKGKLFLAGSSSLHLDVGSSKSKYDGEVDEESGYNYFDFNFLPKAGYFFIPNLVGGLYMDVEAYSNKSRSESGYTYKGTTFIIGPFVRYYVPVTDQFMPFAEIQAGFGVDNTKTKYSTTDDWSKSKESVFTYRIGGGATYFFNEIVGCDLFLGYQHDSYKYKDSGDAGRSSDSKSLYNEFTMQLGIVVILDL